MPSLNRTTLIGHLGKDPEVRNTKDGTPVASFSLATTEKWKDGAGKLQEHTEWHTIIAWKRLAELSKKYLTKGKQVFVEGRIRTRQWNDSDGNKHRAMEIIAGQIILLGNRPKQDSGAGSQQTDDPGIMDDDIPF